MFGLIRYYVFITFNMFRLRLFFVKMIVGFTVQKIFLNALRVKYSIGIAIGFQLFECLKQLFWDTYLDFLGEVTKKISNHAHSIQRRKCIERKLSLVT